MKTPPKLILVHGATSSGKTTLTAALQDALLPNVWLAFSTDTIIYSLPKSILNRCNNENDWSEVNWPAIFKGAVTCVKTLIESGNNVIFDAVISNSKDAEQLQQELKGFSCFTVGLHCDLKTTKTRTSARADRSMEETTRSFDIGLSFTSPDITLDSSDTTPQQLAEKITQALQTL